MRKLLALGLLISLWQLSRPNLLSAQEPSRFPLKDADLWVMVGDSITAQQMHSNYFEAFCYARYPTKKFAFRNAGVPGDTIPKAIARFDWDVAAWKPTVVSVELGMNDRGPTTVENYLKQMKEFTGKVTALKARPVYLSPSPENNGDVMGRLGGGNKRLSEYSEALKFYAADQKAPFADQFHQLVDVWGKNKTREFLANNLAILERAAEDDKMEGVEHLRAFLEAQQRKGQLVAMKGDPVHPGEPGQLMMAAALLKDLGADGLVSSATLKSTGQVTEQKKCKLSEVKVADGSISFNRLDESLPFPMPDEARTVLQLFPTILELSQYMLKVTDLEGRYLLKVNGVILGSVTGDELSKGVNLTIFAKGPIAAQGKEILAAVAAKEKLVGAWRVIAKRATAADADADLKAQFTALTKKVEEADEKIRAAAKPKTLHFELVPAK